jgi:hypothetical protein
MERRPIDERARVFFARHGTAQPRGATFDIENERSPRVARGRLYAGLRRASGHGATGSRDLDPDHRRRGTVAARAPSTLVRTSAAARR